MPENPSFAAPSVSRDAAALSLLLDRHSRNRVRKLWQAADNPMAALAADYPQLGVARARLAIARRQELCIEHGVGLLCPTDSGFPPLLGCIPDAPLVIYYRGDLTALDRPAIAVVGARRASRYGLALAEALGSALCRRGATLVSGLALGIDGAAHRGALAGQGQTIAVLGSGLNRVQPQSHLPLGRQILTAGGLHVSEYPLNLPAAAHQFPERNRLISGLSAGVVVIEAGVRSGSLITARLAAEQGREVMAVPGAPGLANSAGVNRLLKAGAALIETVDDVLDALGLHLEPAQFDRELANRPGIRTPELSPDLARVLDALNGQAVDPELLAAKLNLALTDCTVRLTELELAGFVQRVPDGYIRRPSEF